MTIKVKEITLTEKQKKILYLAANGKTYKEMAKEMECEITTVKHHLYVIRMKLNTVNTTHSVAIAMKLGLI